MHKIYITLNLETYRIWRSFFVFSHQDWRDKIHDIFFFWLIDWFYYKDEIVWLILLFIYDIFSCYKQMNTRYIFSYHTSISLLDFWQVPSSLLTTKKIRTAFFEGGGVCISLTRTGPIIMNSKIRLRTLQIYLANWSNFWTPISQKLKIGKLIFH